MTDEPYVVRWSKKGVVELPGGEGNYLVLVRYRFMLYRLAVEVAEMLNTKGYRPNKFCDKHMVTIHWSLFRP